MSVMTLRTFSGSSHGLRPRPGTSFRPSMPFSSNRDDHSETVLTLTPSSAATDCSLRPSARSRMIRARNASRWRLVGDLTRRRSTVLSSGVSSMTETGRAIAVVWHVFGINTRFFYYGTLAPPAGNRMSISRLPHLENRTQLVPIGHHHFGAVALRLFGRVGFYLVATIAARRWTMRAIE